MKKKKKPSIRNQYKESAAFLKETLRYIYASIAIFVIAGIIGFAFRAHLTFLDKILAELLLKTEGLGPVEIILFIFQNNFMSSLYAVVLGLLVGVMPLISSVTNGALVGYVLGRAYDISGFTEWWRLLPHGVFELPAIFISLGLGFKLGIGLLKNYSTHYWSKSKAIVLFPAVLGLIFSLFSIPFIKVLIQQTTYSLPQSFLPLLFAQILIILVGGFYVVFIISTMIADKKMRLLQKEFLKHDFSNAIVTFFLVVLPLLIIAAIIEGILITYLG